MTDEKVVIITGASQGIGASLLSAYCDAGYKVVANSRSTGASTNPNVFNVAGDIGDPKTADRIMSEGSLNAATKALAIEYAARGIRVNAVAPGTIKTPMHPEPTDAALAALHPVGRMGEIHDVVSAVMYLESAQFVTGEISHVDGGQSAGHW